MKSIVLITLLLSFLYIPQSTQLYWDGWEVQWTGIGLTWTDTGQDYI